MNAAPVTTAAGRDLLAQLPHRLSAEVLARLDRFDRLLGPELAPLAVGETGWIARLARMRWGALALGWPRAIGLLWDACDERQRASLQGSLLRALDPLAGMVSVPLERLFTPDEAQAILRSRSEAVAAPTDLRQAPGRALDYGGYLCVILKVTRLCNLRCTYCHDWSDSVDSHAGFALLLRALAQSLQLGRGYVDLVLHGGEPLMMGRRGLLRLLAVQVHLGLGGQVVRTHLQTNATLVDDWWLDALDLFGIQTSVSLDGPPALHDRSRPDALGRGSYRRVRDGLERLRARGLLSGVLMVVTEDVLALGPQALHAFFRQEGMLSVCLIPQRGGADLAGSIDYARFIDFLVRFDALNAAGDGAPVRVREIEAVRRLCGGAPAGFCEMAGNCVGAFVSIESDGAVSHCDKYLGNADYVLGNLWREDLAGMLDGAAAARIRERAYGGLAALRACPHFHLCQGGCPHERHVSGASVAQGCCGMAPLFDALAGHAAPSGRSAADA